MAAALIRVSPQINRDKHRIELKHVCRIGQETRCLHGYVISED
jgi:hypothetical protein